MTNMTGEHHIRARDAMYPPETILTGEKLDRRILIGIIDQLRAQPANVWVLLEYRRDKPYEKHLYGVFLSEEAARADYGEPDDRYLIDVVKCRTSPPVALAAVAQ